MSGIAEIITSRISANHYDSSRELTDQQISDLIELATHSPSAFNAQNWKFVAIRSPEAKACLLPIAFGQQKVVDAAVTFIVCGTLNPQDSLPAALKPSKDAGIMDEVVYEKWLSSAQSVYRGNPQLQRDEAIRSASLAAMTLMLAAQGQGLVSTAIIGFSTTKLAEAFELAPGDVPAMLVTVGYPGKANWQKKPRRPVKDVLTLV